MGTRGATSLDDPGGNPSDELRGKTLRGWRRPRGKGRFAQFTARACNVMALAQEEAKRLGHDYIGTEHLLLGLLREEEGVAAKVLANLGMDLEAARNRVEHIIGRGQATNDGERSLTPRLKRALELAGSEARDLDHRYLGTEHLLLGLLREAEGVAAGVLNSFGVGYKQGHAAVMALLAGLEQVAWTEGASGKSIVVTCRVDERDLAAIDVLIEAGVRTTRSDAAAWLIHAGIEANAGLFTAVGETVAEIRRLREHAQTLAQQVAAAGGAPAAMSPEDSQSAAPSA